MTNKESNTAKENRVWFSRLAALGWVFLITLLLVLIIKPYNKSHQNLGKEDYGFNNSTPGDLGYVADYGGIADFVSNTGQASAGFYFKETQILRLKTSLKKGEGACKVVFLNNGFPVDSVNVSPEDKQSTLLKVRKNDDFKILVRPEQSGKHEVAVKLERRSLGVQLQLYAFILLLFVVMAWLGLKQGVRHLIYPTIFMILAVYAEHLYPLEYWIGSFPTIAALTGFLIFVRITTTWLPIKIFGKAVAVLLDYLSLLLILFCLVFVLNFKRFGIRLDFDSIVALLQSNSSEAIEFMRNEMPWWSWIGLAVLVLSPVLLNRLFRSVSSRAASGWSWIYTLILGFIGVLGFWNLNFTQEFVKAYTQYYEEIEKFNEVQRRFKTPGNLEASKEESGETYVIVIGESQSKDHMSVYGYHKPTTPFLDSMKAGGDFLTHQKAYSCHTHTIMVLQQALTQANQYNGLRYTKVPTLMNVLNAAGFETTWLSNQVKLSNWDNVVSAIAAGCDNQIFVNKNIGETVDNTPFDERVLPELEKLLSVRTKKNRVVFVHLMGNHGKYDQRYPSDFPKMDSYGKLDYGRGKNLHTWESYDNSIRYNDWMLRRVHEIMYKRLSGNYALCYFADHGEDLEEGRGHNSGMFTHRMTQIPFFCWLSDDYKAARPQVASAFTQNSNSWYSNDLIFQSIIGLTGTQTALYQPKYDVFHEDFKLDTLLVKEGRYVYTAPENIYVWSASNSDTLIATNQNQRIGIHRVNSFGKADEVKRNRHGCVEIDVKIRVGEDTMIEVGHGEEEVMSGMSLMNYLDYINPDSGTRIWLDVKNLDLDNHRVLMSELEALEARYNLKNRLILETSSTGYFVKGFARMGYHVSYYVPTETLALGPSERRKRWLQIARQCTTQGLSAVSFDASLYKQVKKELEPLLPGNIVYHTWDLDIDVRHGMFLDNLTSRDYNTDLRVKTILVRFPSVFDL
ncbi:MAG: phosphoethanolamine transferase [Bacteroidia bacterium]|nr:phosphoethanolamine transferase [Bacteroidia bacterium]